MISVIVTSYNRLEYLKKAVESIKSQERSDIEIVITDDCSTDNSWDWIKEQTLQSDKIIGVRQVKNYSAPCRPRNDGFLVSAGEFINFLDDDNEFLPGRIKTLIESFNPSINVVYSTSLCVKNGKFIDPPWGIPPKRFDADRLERINFVDNSEPIVRRAVFDKVGLFDEQLEWNEEWDLWRRIAKAGFTFLYVPQQLNRYSVHWDDSRTGMSSIWQESNIRIYNKHQRLRTYDVTFRLSGEKELQVSSFGQFDKEQESFHTVLVCKHGTIQPVEITTIVREPLDETTS
jgi:glycosyltransferase involved in cell wall biosynthesis